MMKKPGKLFVGAMVTGSGMELCEDFLKLMGCSIEIWFGLTKLGLSFVKSLA